MKMTIDFVTLGILFLLASFFAASETALFSLSKIEKRRIEKSPSLFSRWVMDHLQHPRRTLMTVLIGNMLVHILATAMTAIIAMHYLGTRGLGPAMVFFTVVLILFGEIIPKVIAVRSNEAFALGCAIPLRLFSILFYPARILAQMVADRLLTLMAARKKINPQEPITQEELKAMISVGEKDGVLDRQERYMIHKLFELGERPVKDIMTPRIDLKVLNIEGIRSKHLSVIRQYHFSHFPVYQESRDNILGVVSAQQYVLHPEASFESLMKQPLFVPETKPINDLLKEFKTKNENYAVCIDEYGGTAGVVTLEDVLEEIFGEYYDEYAQVEHPIRPVSTGEYVVEAKISLSQFNEFFKTHLEAKEASTVGGFILEQLGEIPVKGKEISLPECDLRIQEVLGRRRIHRLIVRIKKKP